MRSLASAWRHERAAQPGRNRFKSGVVDEPVPIGMSRHPNCVAGISQRSTNAEDRGEVSYGGRRGHDTRTLMF